jgi:hypothetical protein
VTTSRLDSQGSAKTCCFVLEFADKQPRPENCKNWLVFAGFGGQSIAVSGTESANYRNGVLLPHGASIGGLYTALPRGCSYSSEVAPLPGITTDMNDTGFDLFRLSKSKSAVDLLSPR